MAYNVGKEDYYKYKKLITDRAYKKTDGSEFCKTRDELFVVKSAFTEVYYLKCDYCGKEIIALWDGYNATDYAPYLGMQSKRINTYNYSPIISILRKRYSENGLDWKSNNLLNSHTRIHSDSYDIGIRMTDKAMRLLCNDCFQKTYNRYLIEDSKSGITYALTVLEDEGETVESLINEFNIKNPIIKGKGSIKDYK